MNASGSPWPTPAQEAVLRAILQDGEHGAEAARSWWLASDLARLDPGCSSLLPQLYGHWRRRFGSAIPAKIRGAHAQAWCRNRLLFRRVRDVLGDLRAAGVPVLLTKGVPLALLYYQDPGARPMADADLFIKPEHGDAARAVLARHGFQPAAGRSAFRDAASFEIDLLGFAVRHRPGIENDWWSAARSFEVDGVEAKCLCPADLLLHVIVHGLAFNPAPPVRWVTDAAVILGRDGTGLDWERLLDQARRFELLLPVRNGLFYLERLLAAPLMPSAVRCALRAHRPTLAQRVEQRMLEQPPEHPLLGHFPRILLDHAIARRREPSTAPNLMTRLQEELGASRASLVPVIAARKALRRLAPLQR